MARGRVSQAALNVVTVDDGERQEPLEHLTDEQKLIWTETCEALPPDWFNKDTLPLLEQYCVLIDRLRTVNRKMRELEVGTREYVKLLTSEGRMQRCLCTLATKMRISQQSTYDKSKRKPKVVKT